MFAISIVNDLGFGKFDFCQLLKKKSEFRRYKFENLLIAIFNK